MSLPVPMDDEQFTRLAVVEHLSDDQRFAAQQMFADYQKKAAELDETQLVPLKKLSIRIERANRKNETDSTQWAEYRDDQLRYCAAVARIEEELFGELDAILADSQQPSLEESRLTRSWQRSIDVFCGKTYRPIRLDCVLMIDQFLLDRETVSEDEMNALRAVRLRFLREYAKTVETESLQSRRQSTKASILLDEMNATRETNDAVEASRLNQEREQAMAGTIRFMKTLATANRKLLQEIRSEVGDDLATRFDLAYRGQCYPELFTIRQQVSPRPLRESIFKNYELTDQQRADITALETLATAEIAAIETKWAAQLDALSLLPCLGRAVHVSEMDALKDRASQLAEERRIIETQFHKQIFEAAGVQLP